MKPLLKNCYVDFVNILCKMNVSERKPNYSFVSEEFKPVERQKKASSYGKSGRVESGMRYKGLYLFISSQ